MEALPVVHCRGVRARRRSERLHRRPLGPSRPAPPRGARAGRAPALRRAARRSVRHVHHRARERARAGDQARARPDRRGLGLDRASLAELGDDPGAIYITSSWQREGIERVPLRVVRAMFPWMRARLMERQVVRFSRPEDLPAEAAVDRSLACRVGDSVRCGHPAGARRHRGRGAVVRHGAIRAGVARRARSTPPAARGDVRVRAGAAPGGQRDSRERGALHPHGGQRARDGLAVGLGWPAHLLQYALAPIHRAAPRGRVGRWLARRRASRGPGGLPGAAGGGPRGAASGDDRVPPSGP